MATLVLTASWGAETNSTTKFPNDGGDGCGGFSSVAYRVAEKFNITTLPTDATVTKVELTITVQSADNDGSLRMDVDGYNNDGLADPEADAAATMFTRCAVAGIYLNDTATFNTTGTKSLIDLGATAVSDLQAARAAGAIYSIAIRALAVDEAGNSNTVFDEYTASSTKPTITITYTPAAGGGSKKFRHSNSIGTRVGSRKFV